MPKVRAEIVPELLMAPEKVVTFVTMMPVGPAEIVPALVMTPEKLLTFVTEMPLKAAEIVPEFEMPPETAALFSTRIPLPDGSAVIEPRLTTAPLIVLLVTVMPVLVGAAAPVAVMEPPAALVILPVKEVPVASMQLRAPLFVKGNGPVKQGPAQAAGIPAPIKNVTNELDAGRPSLRRRDIWSDMDPPTGGVAHDSALQA